MTDKLVKWLRSSSPEVSYFYKIVFLKFRKICKNTPKQEPLFLKNKVPGLKTAILLKKRLWHKCFPVNFVKVFRAIFCRTPLVAISDG